MAERLIASSAEAEGLASENALLWALFILIQVGGFMVICFFWFLLVGIGAIQLMTLAELRDIHSMLGNAVHQRSKEEPVAG